jgi:hypothetical protein
MASIQDLMGLGMPAPLANLLGNGSIPATVPNDTFYPFNDSSGTVRGILKLSAANNTVLNAVTGQALQFTINSVVAGYFDSSLNFRMDGTNGGDIAFDRVGKGLRLKQGSNGRTGTFVVNGATPVVVGNTNLAAGDVILFQRDVIGGTPGNMQITARTNGTSFTITGTAADTSTMRYILVGTDA